MEERLRFSAEAQEKNVTVGTIYSVGFSYLPSVQAIFNQTFSDETLQISYLHPSQVREHVKNDLIDLGVVSFPQNRNEFEVIPWIEEPMVVAVSPNHPLADEERIKVSQLNGLELISYDRDLMISREVDSFLKEHGVTMATTITFDNIEAIKRAVESSRQLAIQPESALKRELAAGTLRELRFSDTTMSRPLGVIYKKGNKITGPMQQFIELLFESDAGLKNIN